MMIRPRRILLRGSALLAGAVIAAAGTLATAREAEASTCCAFGAMICYRQTTCTSAGCVSVDHYYGEVQEM